MDKTPGPEIAHDEDVSQKREDIHNPSDASLEEGSHFDDPKRNARLARRFDWHILPLCAWVYLLNYLDRGNIGNAKVLNQETGDSLLLQTGMGANEYAITVSLFSVAYALFEVPSNWIMKNYVRPSLWLGILLFAWGAFTMSFSGVQNFPTVVILRFFIGVFEAGFFPGIVYLTTFWYRVEERSVRIAFVLASATAAGAFGGCIAYGVGHMNQVAGLEGFRWLSIIEGLVTVLSVLLVVFFLPDYPSRAPFLNSEDKKFAEGRLQRQGGGFTKTHATKAEIIETCFSPRMLAHYSAYVTDCVPLGSLTFFTPTIVNGLGYSSIEAQLMTVPPWIVGYVVCLTLAWSADHFNARGWHITLSSVLGGIGWLTAGLLPADAYLQRYGCLMLCACGAFPSAGPLSAWVTCNVPSIVTMGVATALNNSAAGISQVIAQWIWRASEADRGYPTGNFVCAGASFVTATIAVGLRLHYGRLNRIGGTDASGKKRVWLY
ncbi:MFS general substrate transporter [Zopfia rhizophila CBS 207.26]|uniref:MFS general substrate transporter n=1 Tax=Zopfia rhizophila CBS 207.26 TaxID=1314779 RepID=A0A6A6D5U7_9PEZI|nr:MFS general substrate transporter [Zopfia rhizophila CBS 207.26]